MFYNKCKTINIFLMVTIFCYLQSWIGMTYSLWNPVTIIGWILLCIFISIYRGYCKLTSQNALLLCFILFGQILGFLYSVQTDIINTHIYKLIEFFLCYILMFTIPISISLKKRNVEKVLLFIISIAIISSSYALIFQFGVNVFRFRDSSNFNIANVYVSFWTHRNTFALVLLAGMVSALYFTKYDQYKLLSYIVFCFLGFNLIFTFSRTAYVSIFIFFIIFVGYGYKKHKVRSMFLILAFFALFYIYLKNPFLKKLMDTYMIRRKSGLTGRDHLWRSAMELLNLPTLIYGRSMGVEQLLLKDDPISLGAGFHNVYLASLIEGGVFYVVPLTIQFFDIVRCSKQKIYPKDQKTFKWIVAARFTFLIYPFFETSKFFNMGLGSFLQTFFVFTIPYLFINSYD